MFFTRNDEDILITDELMGTIATYMDDEIREDLHFQLAPCSSEYFLEKYLEQDPEFRMLLEHEFNIKTEDCFTPEEDIPYPLCSGRGWEKCKTCQLARDMELPGEIKICLTVPAQI